MNRNDPGAGCAWLMIAVVICLAVFGLVSEIARGVTWIRWAFT